ncbi:MAG: hypothetical protein V4561_12210 [Bacteroidota bacterium]
MNKQIDIDNAFERLKELNPVYSDNLSYETLMNKIELVKRERAPKVMVAGALLALTLVLSFNFMSFQRQDKASEKNLVTELGLMNNPSIYGGI